MSKRRKNNKINRDCKKKGTKLRRLFDLLKQCRESKCCPLRKTEYSMNQKKKVNDPIKIFGSIDPSECVLPEKGDILIKKPSDYRNLSIINRSTRLSNFMMPEAYYTIAIEALHKMREMQDNSVKDSIIYPILYNFRHYLEIIMKDSIRNFKIAHKEITSQQIGYEGDHSLLKTWNKLKHYISFSENAVTEDFKSFEKLINEINRIDDQSFSFRYSYKAAKKIEKICEPIFKDMIDVDLENLEKVMKKMHRFIEGISDLSYNQREASEIHQILK